MPPTAVLATTAAAADGRLPAQWATTTAVALRACANRWPSAGGSPAKVDGVGLASILEQQGHCGVVPFPVEYPPAVLYFYLFHCVMVHACTDAMQAAGAWFLAGSAIV